MITSTPIHVQEQLKKLDLRLAGEDEAGRFSRFYNDEEGETESYWTTDAPPLETEEAQETQEETVQEMEAHKKEHVAQKLASDDLRLATDKDEEKWPIFIRCCYTGVAEKYWVTDATKGSAQGLAEEKQVMVKELAANLVAFIAHNEIDTKVTEMDTIVKGYFVVQERFRQEWGPKIVAHWKETGEFLTI